MMTNEYIGSLKAGASLDEFTTKVKQELGGDSVKIIVNGSLMRFQCNGDIANKLRKYKELSTFRCDKLGVTQQPSPQKE